MGYKNWKEFRADLMKLTLYCMFSCSYKTCAGLHAWFMSFQLVVILPKVSKFVAVMTDHHVFEWRFHNLITSLLSVSCGIEISRPITNSCHDFVTDVGYHGKYDWFWLWWIWNTENSQDTKEPVLISPRKMYALTVLFNCYVAKPTEYWNELYMYSY
jgi:hypothetical protein